MAREQQRRERERAEYEARLAQTEHAEREAAEARAAAAEHERRMTQPAPPRVLGGAPAEGMVPVATLSLSPEAASHLVSASVHLADESAHARPRQHRAHERTRSPTLRIPGVRTIKSKSPRGTRDVSPTEPTEASRGWRVAYSPDWHADSRTPEMFVAARREYIGRTAATHHPWAETHVAADGGRHGGGTPTGGATPGAVHLTVRHKKRSTRKETPRSSVGGGARLRAGFADDDDDDAPTTHRQMWAVDRDSTLAYQAGFAWTHHDFAPHSAFTPHAGEAVPVTRPKPWPKHGRL
jgi:hypothetical protein